MWYWQIFFRRFFAPIDDPSSRLFYWNIIISFTFVVIYCLCVFNGTEVLSNLRAFVLRKKYWWNRSTILDYKIYVFNGLLKVFLLIPVVECSFEVSRWTVRNLTIYLGDMSAFAANTWNLILFTIAVFIFDDLLRYINHLLLHKVPFLWRCHQVHHSARVITPITLFRTHPAEILIATIRNSVSLGLSIGVFIYLFESTYNVLNFMGVNLFAFIFNILASHLRHSHIPFSFGFLEWLFVSPRQHQIHHSSLVEHADKNFGVSLSIWDIFLGCNIFSKQVPGRIPFGTQGVKKHSLLYLFLRPFKIWDTRARRNGNTP